MAFTCLKCHLDSMPHFEEYKHTISVAQDATAAGRHGDAKTLRDQAHDILVDVNSDYHLKMYEHGHHESWPSENQWLPGIGVSVGPCETCDRERPCVNV